MILENRTAVVYGAGGRVGGAVAKGLAAEGARCFLVGPRPGPLDAVAAEIRAAGGQVETAVVDILDRAAVDDHADATARRAGVVDISVGDPVPDLPGGDRITAQFLTIRAAARHMTRQGSGVILVPGVAAGAAAVEALRRRWERALGPHGIRVVALPVSGLPPAELGRTAASLAAGPAASTPSPVRPRSEMEHSPMTRYFLTLPHDTADEPTMESMQDMDPAELAAVMAAVEKFNTDLNEAGAFVTAGGLEPPSTAITVETTSAGPTRTPEPFVQADQYVGGFWIIEAADQEAALVWAEQASAALQSRVEVRALQSAPE